MEGGHTMSSYDEARAAYFKFRETYALDAEIAGLVALTIIAADIDLAEKDKEIKARIALWKTDAGAWQKMVNEKDAEIIMWKNACRSRSKEADEKDKELARLKDEKEGINEENLALLGVLEETGDTGLTLKALKAMQDVRLKLNGE
jgi:hypothetical protein